MHIHDYITSYMHAIFGCSGLRPKRFHAEINQFVNGLDKVASLHKEILHPPEAFSSLFVHQAVHLKFDTFRLLYEVNFSPEGSNNRRLEKDTVYCLEAFLIECDVAGGCCTQPGTPVKKSTRSAFVSLKNY
ncbi:uncharacterized protein LOC128546033 [Mercenaria mercenaria]|uniref:uncharacterized protein LOC128546033 n=1 Tax=Mercenaria mercenaria TaxID=6596 RepID=UPI00234EF170|nr:uncharacterized protein LOC128546033 [Mercenaria mercenaria]